MSYKIKKGDTLWGIAKKNGTTISEILQLNPQIQDPNYIRAGNTLKLNNKGVAVSTLGTESFDEKSGVRHGDYTIRKGDALWSIARRNGMTVNEILELNPQIKDRDFIRAGDTVKLKRVTDVKDYSNNSGVHSQNPSISQQDKKSKNAEKNILAHGTPTNNVPTNKDKLAACYSSDVYDQRDERFKFLRYRHRGGHAFPVTSGKPYLEFLVLLKNIKSEENSGIKKTIKWVKDLVDPFPSKISPKKSKWGFNAHLFEKNDTYYLAFEGTRIVDRTDWDNNLEIDKFQYESAIKLARKMMEKVGKENLILTGHSLGGSLASAAASQTGLEAVTFNASGIADEYKNNADNITNHTIIGEIVNDGVSTAYAGKNYRYHPPANRTLMREFMSIIEAEAPPSLLKLGLMLESKIHKHKINRFIDLWNLKNCKQDN